MFSPASVSVCLLTGLLENYQWRRPRKAEDRSPKFGVEETLVSFLLITRIRAYVVTIYISMAFHPSPRHILCFMRFMLYTVCKTLRLSVFNKELFD